MGWLALLMALALTSGCERNEGEGRLPITVFAAASTTDAVAELAARYEESQAGIEIRCSFAGSSTLARQIASGAPAEVFLSANPSWMDHLESQDLLEPGSRLNLLGNELVVIAGSAATEADLEALRAGAALSSVTGRVALADPTHVPAGQYAKQALESLGWWSEIEPRVVAAVDVRAALRLVDMGEAAWGLTYATDARADDRVVVVRRIDARHHDAITYPLALCRGASEEAARFAAYLTSAESREVFQRYGFTMPQTGRE
jgi:molybdate transport system substrate-binding protein